MEYGLIIALIIIAMIFALQGVVGATIDMWAKVETESLEALN